MKKLLTLVLLLLLTAVPALAETAAYGSTQAFLDLLTAAGEPFEVYGMDEDGCERILLPAGVAGFDGDVTVIFDPYEENASLRVWYLIRYDAAMAQQIMECCAALNAQHRFVCFYADGSDNTVTASMDLIFRGSDAGPVTVRALRQLRETLRRAYPQLMACVSPGETPAPATPTPFPTATPTPAAQTVVITADSAILRSAPGTAGSYVATVRAGDSFPLLGTAKGWYALDFNGRRAYVSADKAQLQ